MMICQSLYKPKKSFFFKVQHHGLKKIGDKDFDVPMNCFDGAEICKLVGTYIQSKLTNIMGKEDVGLHPDDALSIFKNISRP